ncbi:Spondin_N [Seminavis robusta]|uniref:Spondin_N n=1 Tax=Seminavis robusta TaxID=568900 RepID=A0A9N8DNW8_9STRA|nr:Spondin_N [Seminavis robusta]|eukprot:Sro252_g099700.1 Spondin_N (246) ;mRNA; r:79131-79868
MKLLLNFIVLSLSAVSLAAASAAEPGLRRRRRDQMTTVLTEPDSADEGPVFGGKVTVKFTNEAFQQPFGPFFVLTHNTDETPLFTVGDEASAGLKHLAENGDPSMLIEAYNNSAHAGYVDAIVAGVPFFGGDSLELTVPYDEDFPYISVVSMAINTNDCFVGLSGVPLAPGLVVEAPGYDSGTEENNELCSSIPGPACAGVSSDNEASGNGEGFVHVHRGFFGVGDLSQSGYDWRNPMMKVEMSL